MSTDALQVQAPVTQLEQLVRELYGAVPLIEFLRAMTAAGLALQVNPDSGGLRLVSARERTT